MPQPGVHAILALATRRTFSTKRLFASGLVFGALLPDLDGYGQAFGILVQGLEPDAAEAIYHRTLTHSLFFAMIIAVIFYLISPGVGREGLRHFGFGLAVGIALLHSVVDIFAWFDGVGLLWPVWSINLWSWLTLPEIAGKLLHAANFWAFAGYFVYLAGLARRAKTTPPYLPWLRYYTYAQAALAIIFTALAFILPAPTYNTFDGTALLLLAYPNALWVTWRMRATIEEGR